jgi:hypothetical protein
MGAFLPWSETQTEYLGFNCINRSMRAPHGGVFLVGSLLESKSMKFSRILTGILSVALLAFMVSDTLGKDQGRRGDRGGRGGAGGGQRGGPGGGGQRGGQRGGGDPTMQLLRIEEVRVELQIAPDQEEALTKMAEQGRGERPDFGNIRDMSEEERTALFAKMRKEQEERTKKMKEQLEEVLVLPQIERLEQLALQFRGIQALSDEKVVAALKITEAQKKKMEEVRSKQGEQMRELFASGDRDKMREAFGKMRQELEDGTHAVLTSDQKKEFEEMKGEAFEFPESARAGFGGGGGPGGGRGGTGGGERGGRGGGERGAGGRGGERRQRPPADEN